MKPMDAISSGIPVWALVALSVVVVQLTIDVIALLDLYRRPVEQVVFGNKWIWALLVGHPTAGVRRAVLAGLRGR
ncbi:MAG TPA: hypothetical protein VIM49_05095 [Dermatophilaceae bacterium]|jgi:hypothetical protein